MPVSFSGGWRHQAPQAAKAARCFSRYGGEHLARQRSLPSGESGWWPAQTVASTAASAATKLPHAAEAAAVSGRFAGGKLCFLPAE
jgi:hypothetical protein